MSVVISKDCKYPDDIRVCSHLSCKGDDATCKKTNMNCVAAKTGYHQDTEINPEIMCRCPLTDMRTQPRTKEEILAANSRGECLAFVDKYGKMKYISTYGLGLTDDEILDYIKEFIDSGNVFHPEQAISWTQRKEISGKKTAQFRYVFK